jgi:O-antigen/teichoic acid export membrane protein
MAGLGGFLKQFGHYSIASLAVIVAGIISYPILTRVLTVEEYGVMGAIVTLVTLAVAVSKMGLQVSIVRLYPEWARKEAGVTKFIFTLFATTLTLATSCWLVGAVATVIARPWIDGEVQFSFFILLASPLVVIRTLNNFGVSVFRATERSKLFAIFEVTSVYVAMILAVLGVTVVIGGLTGYYIGLVIGEGIVMLLIIATVLKGTRLTRSNLELGLVRETLGFGLPMALFEACGVLFFMADRFVILWLLDERALGYYSVGYSLAMYVNNVFSESLDRAARPAYTNLYESEGPEATSEFLRKAIRLFLLFALPAIAGMWIIREDILVLLASEKFRPSASVVHLLLMGFLIYGSSALFGAGLFLKKQPWKMAGMDFLGAVLSIGLNILLVPYYNIQGAALGTVIAQTIVIVLLWLSGKRLVKTPVDVLPLLKYLFCAAAMATGCHFIDVGLLPVRLVLRILAGVVIYGGLVLALDGEARALFVKIVDKVRGRLGGGGEGEGGEGGDGEGGSGEGGSGEGGQSM